MAIVVNGFDGGRLGPQAAPPAEMGLDELAAPATAPLLPEARLLTVAMVPQFFEEPGENQLAPVLRQTDAFVQLLVLDNGAIGFNEAWLANKMIEYRQKSFGETSPLCGATVKRNPAPLAHSCLLRQAAELAQGHFVLFLLGDDTFLRADALAVLQAALPGLVALPGAPAPGLLLPVCAGAQGQPAMAGNLPLDAILVERQALAALPVDDLAPTLCYALNEAARREGGFARLREAFLGRVPPCPAPEWALLSGRLSPSRAGLLLGWGAQIRDAADDRTALLRWHGRLGRAIEVRTERALARLWGFSLGERDTIRFLQALQLVVGRHLEQETQDGAAFIRAVDVLLGQAESATEKPKFTVLANEAEVARKQAAALAGKAGREDFDTSPPAAEHAPQSAWGGAGPAGPLSFSCGQRLLRWGREMARLADDEAALFGRVQKLGQEALVRLERAAGGYWGFSESEKRYIRLLRALRQAAENRLEAGAAGREAFGRALEMLLRQVEESTRKKARIVFLTQEYTVWPSLESFYRHCAADGRFETALVYVPFSRLGAVREKDIAPYRAAGLPVIPYNKIDLADAAPDVVVLVKAYDVMPPGWLGEDLARTAEALAYVPYHISLFGASAVPDPFARGMDVFFSSQPVQAAARYFVVDSPGLAAHTAANNIRAGDNLLRAGHPRMDLYGKTAPLPPLPPGWAQKLRGRTAVLYNSHHTEAFTTFFDYFEDLLAFFAVHEDLALIWRPHPMMEARFRERGLVKEGAWEELMARLAAAPNVVCDLSASYREAFAYSQALLTDISSLLIEYMFLNRPILLLRRRQDAPDRYRDYLRPELLAVVEQAGGMAEIEAFIGRTQAGADENAEARRRFLAQGVYGYGTNVSAAIADAIYEDLRQGSPGGDACGIISPVQSICASGNEQGEAVL